MSRQSWGLQPGLRTGLLASIGGEPKPYRGSPGKNRAVFGKLKRSGFLLGLFFYEVGIFQGNTKGYFVVLVL